jgi:hypothetical protein
VQIGLINNLRAGRNYKQVSRVLDLLRSYPHVSHVETDRKGALPDAIADLARREIDLLVVNGGDGTLQHTLTELLVDRPFQRTPMIAPLAGGRTNMTALDLGACRNPVKGLKAVLDAAEAGALDERIVDRPVIRIESEGGRRVTYGMFFGAGLIRRAVSLVHDIFPNGSSQGAFGAGVTTLALVAKAASKPKDGILTPDKIQILLDDRIVGQGEFYLTISTTLRRLFWGLEPFWGREKEDLRFTSIESRASRFAAAAPGILRGKPRDFVLPDNGYTSVNVGHAALRMGCGFTVDGEIFDQQSDEVVKLSAGRPVVFVRA